MVFIKKDGGRAVQWRCRMRGCEWYQGTVPSNSLENYNNRSDQLTIIELFVVREAYVSNI